MRCAWCGEFAALDRGVCPDCRDDYEEGCDTLEAERWYDSVDFARINS